ncbi:Type 1 glutamine amidotransferase-like domain-containing protein [Streptosporangium sp. NPDC000396]|uniref:Type 1 glutamine amidotransferase-like domain-containing protein n=1 Tax=Streptosporangium sp. NPDC000396 TaxID=3366185 RepID=UPI003687DF6C
MPRACGPADLYAGYSAGCCVLAPSLRGLELVDDPGAVRELYGADPLWDGLGLLEYAIVPHYRSEHPESEAVELVAAHYRTENVRHRTLRDGQAIVIDS